MVVSCSFIGGSFDNVYYYRWFYRIGIVGTALWLNSFEYGVLELYTIYTFIT